MSNTFWFKRPHIEWETVNYDTPKSYVGGNVIVLPNEDIDPVFFVKPGCRVVMYEDQEGLYPQQLAEYQQGMEYNWSNWPLQESTPEEWEYAQRQLRLLQEEAETAAELEAPIEEYLDLEGKLTGVRYRQF